MNRKEVCNLTEEHLKIRALAEALNYEARGALCIKPILSDIKGGVKIPSPSDHINLWEYLSIKEVQVNL